MTEIRIREPEEQEPGPAPEGESPYRNILVPLVVVPALIVIVPVLVVVLFAGIAGSEDTPAENVERILSGGAKDREQAAFNLVRQVLENLEATKRGEAEAWPIDASLVPRLEEAWQRDHDWEDPGDVVLPLSVAAVQAQLGDLQGVVHLAEITRLPERLDPAGEARFQAAHVLGAMGEDLDAPARAVAARALLDLLEGDDHGLRSIAAIGLQTLDAPGVAEALAGLLTDASLEIRGNAALSLARLGRAEGADVLRAMAGTAAYTEERGRDERRWPPQRVSESRCKALEALARLGLAPPRDELRRLAEDDADPNVRELARRLLAEAG